MKKYMVNLPLVGEASLEVDALSGKDAIRKALDEFAFISLADIENGQILSLYPMDHVIQGNVFYGPLYEAYAEEITNNE